MRDILGVLLEGFDARAHPRGYHGKFIGSGAGRVLRVMHGDTHVGDVPHDENRTQMMIGVGRVVGAAGRTISTQDIGRVIDKATGPVPAPASMLGREGQAARARGAAASTTEHADTRDKLTSLPMGQSYGLHGPMGQVGRVDRTAKGWEVYAGGESTPKVHRTPSSAAGHAMRIQRSAAVTRTDVSTRNYRGAQEVRAMNARQSQMAAAERLRAEMDRHGGFKIGDVVTHETGSREAGGHGPVTFTRQPGLSTVVGLQRNGNLRLKEPVHGTTHDVHHSHAQKVSPLHPDYRGKVVQDAYAAQKAEVARQKAERARRSGRALSESVLDALLLEGFAPAPQDPAPDFPQSDFTTGDRVAVSAKGHQSIVARVVRPHEGTHAIVAPEGGGPHVKAPIGDVRLHTPAQHALRARREAAAALRQAQQTPGPGAPATSGVPGTAKQPPAPVREGVGLMLEAFTAPTPTSAETPAQSNAIARKQVAAAQKSLSSGWNASKHPRGQGGKFGYTTGGKRAKRSPAANSRTLGQGSSGTLVKAIQRQLNIPADGKYGPQTRSAIERYQRQHQLQVDGVVGAQTLAALRGHVNARLVAPGPITSKQATVTTHPAARSARSGMPLRVGGGVVVGL